MDDAVDIPQLGTPETALSPSHLSMPAWRTWPREQLWLSPDPTQPGVRTQMRAALADAVSNMPTADIERIAELAEQNDAGSALRLIARLVRARGNDQHHRDLAGCALLLAVIDYQDEHAAVELAVLTSLRAARIPGPPAKEFSYPAPLDRPRRLRARLLHRGRIAVALLAERTGWARALRDLGRMAAGDPLGDVGTSGRQASGWERQ